MKASKLFLLLLLSLCTFNIWAKSNLLSPVYMACENRNTVDLTIHVDGGMPGILHLYINDQPLYDGGYWGDGYMLNGYSEMVFKPQIDVHSGDVIKLYAYLPLEGGNSGTIYVTVPNKETSHLYVRLTKNGNYKISAFFV